MLDALAHFTDLPITLVSEIGHRQSNVSHSCISTSEPIAVDSLLAGVHGNCANRGRQESPAL
jgi:hypothetical protein